MIKDLTVGTKVALKELSSSAHQTQPPPRYSEVSVIKKLAELGIGRPATFNSIVTTIQDRGYVMKVGNQLIPTFLGFAVVNLLVKKFPIFTDYGYTTTMEEKLDEVADWTTTREQFLDQFWNGPSGFASTVDQLMKSVDYDEIRKLSTISLHNGYSIVFNKFGAWLQADDGELNEKGYQISAKIGNEDKIDDYLDVELCAKLMESAKSPVPVESLGVLESGNYKGWTVMARDGKFGAYAQALHPDAVAANDAGERVKPSVPKPVNQALPEGVTLETVTMDDIASLFDEVKLPRWSDDGKWFIGVGKKGPYIAYKATKTGKPQFRSLAADVDPRTISFDDAKKTWETETASAPAPRAAAKKPTAKKAPAKKAATKKASAKK